MQRLADQEITRRWPCALLHDLESCGAKVLLPLLLILLFTAIATMGKSMAAMTRCP